MAGSPPVSIEVPAVGVHSRLLRVGLNKDSSIQVPAEYDTAAWFAVGAVPGSLGPAVIIGHVDSYRGPGVFYRLGAMRVGQRINVARADKSVAHFRVDAVRGYAKKAFPTRTVYGPIGYAGLRLITCGGDFDRKTRSYESNIVVFASLVQPTRSG